MNKTMKDLCRAGRSCAYCDELNVSTKNMTIWYEQENGAAACLKLKSRLKQKQRSN